MPTPVIVEDRQLTAHGDGGTRHDNDQEVCKRATAGAGSGGESRGSTRADNNQPKMAANMFKILL